jgi:hypothetical protein
MQNKQDNSSLQGTQPLVSFIISYYNLPVQMLCECIDSILALSLRPYEREVIVIDDGSNVSPMNALMPYADDITYVRQRNGGLSMARNKGISMATGKYIQFVDADDHLIQATYEHCLDIIRYHDDADMVLFDFSTSDQVPVLFTDQEPVSGTQYMRHNNIHGTAWGYLFSPKTLSELRFTPGIWHEDEEFTPQLLLRAERVYATDAKAYCYQQRPNSITSDDKESSQSKRQSDRLGVIVRLQRLCDKLSQDDRLALQRRIAQLTMDSIYQVIIEKHSLKALDEHLESLRSEGLFPLPDRNYSTKYVWFRRMTNTAVGRALLLHSLPLLKKER